MNTVDIFKALSDSSRLRILENLKTEPMYVELLSQRLGLASSTLSFHLKKLESVGLISSKKEQYYVLYSLNKDFFEKSLNEILNFQDNTVEEEALREEKYRKKVIDTFFEYGYLMQMPVQKKKRDICLLEIFKGFEKGKIYEESQVNEIIKGYYEDYCLIRRYYVEYGLMEREGTIYKVL